MKKILIFLSNGFELLEFSPFIDVFGWNNTLYKNNQIITKTLSLNTFVTSSWNIELKTNFSISSSDFIIEDYDILIIPGGFGSFGFFNDINTPEFKKILNHFLENKKTIVGICTGALALAINNCLKNIPATTYRLENGRYFNQLKSYGAIPVEKEIVIHNNFITSSGPSSAIKVAFLLLEKINGTLIANNVKKNMEY